MARLVLAFFCLICCCIVASAQTDASQRMSFQGEGPKPEFAVILGTAWTIYASGPIDVDAGNRFRKYLNDNRVPPHSFVYLDSRGGSVVGGINLGRVFREYNLEVDVGRHSSGQTQQGECFSACALAFLGGEFRYLKKGSRYGVHRFSFPNDASTNIDVTQVLFAAIAEYVRSMDVDPSLLGLSAITASEDMAEPSASQLLEWRVINNGFSSPKWTLESVPEGVYLKGERNTRYGINKFILGCDDGRPMLYVIIDPQGRGELITGFRADSLYVDGRALRIENLLLRKRLVNGWVNATYILPDTYLNFLRAAKKSVGVTMQGGYDAGIFFGFDAMPFDEGIKKLPGFLRTCKRS